LIGKTLAHYEIIGLLGKGGMGEVYRARDAKLDRDVAIKVLPEVLAHDKELLARFGREAKLLASLNHQNIAGIHELGVDGGTRFLVMELVEGPGLDEHLSAGQMEMDEILALFGQLAEALEFAHERGVIHRDLKPANVKISNDGPVKILDFGLAKALETQAESTMLEDGTIVLGSDSSVLETAEGRILGTPAYMSPEQTRGHEVDKRTDIWAFGCCLYEALTGQRPFQGPTATDVMAEIVKSDPEWDLLPAETPARVRVLLWRCLQKNPRRRLRDIGEARLELSGDVTDPSGVLPSLGTTAYAEGFSRRTIFTACGITLVLGSLVAGLVTRSLLTTASDEGAVARPVKRFEIDIGRAEPLQMMKISAEVAISPDGKRIAYTANVDGAKRLYVRKLEATESVALPGTENCWHPFFSPDGKWIAYFVPGSPASRQGRLMKIAVDDGTPLDLCHAFPPAGGAWLEDGTIVFTSQDEELDLSADPFRAHLFSVSESGGTPERLVKADLEERGELTHVLPKAAIGENFFLFATVDHEGMQYASMFDLESRRHEILLENAFGAQYASSGHLVFLRNGALWAAEFDLESKSVGEPAVVQPGVQMNAEAGATPFALSREGSLVYPPTVVEEKPDRTLVWVDHDGREETIAVAPARYWWPRVSPDGSRVAMSIQTSSGENEDIWIHSFERARSMTRFTFDPGLDSHPLWSPNSLYLYFTSDRRGSGDLFRRRADGANAVQTIWSSPRYAKSRTTGTSWNCVFPLPNKARRAMRTYTLCWIRSSTRAVRSCPPTANGWPTTPTKRTPLRCSCAPIRMCRMPAGRYQRRAVSIPPGRPTAARSTIATVAR
jgi:serine/threonine-protein kinase